MGGSFLQLLSLSQLSLFCHILSLRIYFLALTHIIFILTYIFIFLFFSISFFLFLSLILSLYHTLLSRFLLLTFRNYCDTIFSHFIPSYFFVLRLVQGPPLNLAFSVENKDKLCIGANYLKNKEKARQEEK